MSIFMFSVALKCELILVAELCADKKKKSLEQNCDIGHCQDLHWWRKLIMLSNFLKKCIFHSQN